MKFRLWMGRNSENNKALSFCGSDGLNQRSQGYWHKVYGKYILAESTGMANDEVIEGDSNGGVA